MPSPTRSTERRADRPAGRRASASSPPTSRTSCARRSPRCGCASRSSRRSTASDVRARRSTHALREADRLERTIADLLAHAERRRAGAPATLDLAELVRDHAERWRPLYVRAGRRAGRRAPRRARPPRASRRRRRRRRSTCCSRTRSSHGAGARDRERGGRATGAAVIAVADDGQGVPAGAERAIFERGVLAGGRHRRRAARSRGRWSRPTAGGCGWSARGRRASRSRCRARPSCRPRAGTPSRSGRRRSRAEVPLVAERVERRVELRLAAVAAPRWPGRRSSGRSAP